MSISENYEGEITPIRSNISRFRDAQLLIVTLYLLCFILDGKNQFFFVVQRYVLKLTVMRYGLDNSGTPVT